MIKRMKWGGMLVASLLMASGCQNEEIVQNQSVQGQAFTLTASKGMGSRTAIDGDKTVWSEGDKIYVSSEDGKTTGVLTLIEGAGDDSGTFSGFVFGNPNNLAYSVYPAPINGTTLNLAQIAGANQVNAPMIGKINQNEDVDVQFNHACHVLYVNLPGSAGKTFTITATNNDQPINLAATADVTASKVNLIGEPSLDFISNSESITVTNAKGGEMYIPFYTNATTPNNVKFKVDGIALNTEGVDLTTNNGKLGKLVKDKIQVVNYSSEGFTQTTTVSKSEDLSKVLTEGATSLYLAEGTYTLPAAKGKTLTISGTKETEIGILSGTSQNLTGSTITFNGVTIQGQTSGNYNGYPHASELIFENCTITGKLTLYSKSTFKNCTFNNSSDYAIWTWGATSVDFEECTFNSGGKALLVYGEKINTTVNLTKCTFNDDNTLDTQKAAIETGDNTGNKQIEGFTINITDITVNGFSVTSKESTTFGGTSLGTNVWGNKNLIPNTRLNVVIDGVDVY